MVAVDKTHMPTFVQDVADRVIPVLEAGGVKAHESLPTIMVCAPWLDRLLRQAHGRRDDSGEQQVPQG